MARYIDLDEAVKYLHNECKAKYPNSYANGLSAAINELGKMPVMDDIPTRDEDRYIPLVDENLQRVFDSYKKHVVTELLSDLKKSIHNNAVYTSLGSVNYIPLKTFDAIIQQYVNKLKEGDHES